MGNCLTTQNRHHAVDGGRGGGDLGKVPLRGRKTDETDRDETEEGDDSSTMPLSPGNSTLITASSLSPLTTTLPSPPEEVAMSPYNMTSSSLQNNGSTLSSRRPKTTTPRTLEQPYYTTSPSIAAYASPITTSSSWSPKRTKQSARRREHSYVRSVTDSASPKSSAAPARPGSRELQRRLSKARHLQVALLTTAAEEERRDDDDYDVVPHVSSAGSSSTVTSLYTTASTAKNSRHSLSSDGTRGTKNSRNGSIANKKSSNTANEQLNNEFEASLSRGMVWEQVTHNDDELVVAMSRNKPTLSLSSSSSSSQQPPLFLATGTANGTVTVQRVLDDSPSLLPPTTTTGGASSSSLSPYQFVMASDDDDSSINNKKRRLGASITLQRSGGCRVRSVDFDPLGTYLAVGGDDCNCGIYRLAMLADTDQEEPDELIRLEFVTELARVDRVYAVQFSPDGKYLTIGGTLLVAFLQSACDVPHFLFRSEMASRTHVISLLNGAHLATALLFCAFLFLYQATTRR